MLKKSYIPVVCQHILKYAFLGSGVVLLACFIPVAVVFRMVLGGDSLQGACIDEWHGITKFVKDFWKYIRRS